MAQVGGRQHEGGGRDDRSGAPNRLIDNANLRAVGHAHNHAVAWRHAEFGEAGRQPERPFKQFRGAMPCSLEQQGGIIPVLLERRVREERKILAGAERERRLGHRVGVLIEGPARVAATSLTPNSSMTVTVTERTDPSTAVAGPGDRRMLRRSKTNAARGRQQL